MQLSEPISTLVATDAPLIFDGDVCSKKISGSVTMSRALAASAHGLSLNEARLMMLAMRCLDPRKSHIAYDKLGNVRVRIKADEFAQIAGYDLTSGRIPSSAYEGMKTACERLFERYAIWREGKRVTRLRWVYKVVYHEGEGWAEVGFSPDMTPHLFMLKDKYVRYRLEHAQGLNSIYSSNLLRLLMSYKDTGFLTIKLDDFKHAMEVPPKYTFGAINRSVLGVALKELAAKTDYEITHSLSKQGRAVSSIQFKFQKKAQRELPL